MSLSSLSLGNGNFQSLFSIRNMDTAFMTQKYVLMANALAILCHILLKTSLIIACMCTNKYTYIHIKH